MCMLGGVGCYLYQQLLSLCPKHDFSLWKGDSITGEGEREMVELL